MTSTSFHDGHSNTYDRMASGCTQTVAEKFLAELSPPITASSYVLDNACGTGIVTRLIKAQNPSARVMCTDLAPGMLDIVKSRVQENSWDNVETDVLDVCDLKTLKDDSFTHVLTNFGFASNPKDTDAPKRAAAEMFRVLKKGGVCVVTTWAERNFDKAMSAAALGVRPDEKPFDFVAPPAWVTGSWLMGQLEDAGFGNAVQVKSVDSAITAGSLDELVANMMLFKDMFYKGYTDEEIRKATAVLKEEVRKLPAFEETEGSVRIKMVAWIGVAWKK